MNHFFVGSVLVVGLSLLGCAKQTEGIAKDSASDVKSASATESAGAIDGSSTVDTKTDAGIPSDNGGAEIQQEQGKEDPGAVAHFEAGIAAYQANDLPLAYKEFLAASEKGHADSHFYLGLMYEQGIGVGKDEKEAVVWYGKSAAQGSAIAQFNLGVLYENGRGTKVDFGKANEWYRKASVQGDALAIGNLGMLYVRGDGVTENKVAGVALLLISATADQSPENNARRNITATRGLSTDMIVEAQTLAGEWTNPKNLLVQLDQYLEKTQSGSRSE